MSEIQALKQELEEMKLAYQMMAQISQFKSGFLAKTAHELRSPLSSLIGLHQLIIADLCDSPEEERECVEQGYHAAQKLMEIMDTIIKISKLDYGTIPFNIEILSLNEILNQIYQLNQLQAANYNLKLEINLSEVDINIKADQSYFMQAVTTLIDTGIGFAQRGTILISTQLNSCQNAAEIIINIPCSIDHWQGETSELELSNLNLTTFKKWSSTLEISPSMKLVLSQILLEKMKGQLTLSDSSPENAPKTLTQLQFLIPLATTLENHLLMREC